MLALLASKSSREGFILCSQDSIESGGYIQWIEQDVSPCRLTTATPYNSIEQTQELQTFAPSPTPKWPST